MRTRLAAIGVMLAAVGGMSGARASAAAVDLLWIPQPRTVDHGVLFEIGLFAVAASGDGKSQSMAAMDVVLAWDSTLFELVGVVDNGPYNWLMSGFLPDSGLDALNDDLLDGDAKYTALSNFDTAAVATPEGLLVTTFQFIALAETSLSEVIIKEMLGSFSTTRVFGADASNQVVTGMLHNASITIVPPQKCDGDGDFDLGELDRLQACFTGLVVPNGVPAYPQAPALCCAAFDRDDDGDVDLVDFSFFVGLLTGPRP